MGKSFKKTPIIKENSRGSNKQRKKVANKSIRAELKTGKEIGNGSEYRKHYDSWNVSDYSFMKTEEEALLEYKRATDPNDVEYSKYIVDKYPTKKEFMRWWRRYYKNK